ncbi:ATP-binding protein [Aestuariirhabdus sp. Z084]|uniref:ATP-binding protein n=1 Tax=Aestuariirhabdus haliotis TaxID=2918751 RepID=UPI00201B355D|nr:ATP-binding protein [Aestuariirhabdus haliotis]MCL6414910.1 ATP-binding protein [Aestuariirhabdus haliotis]MCL6418842.1 ATP-binding protein [Aestuariirhabdus haliotis]
MTLLRSRWTLLSILLVLALVAITSAWQLSWQWALQGEIVRTAKQLSLHAQSIDNALGQFRYIALEVANNEQVQQLLNDNIPARARRTNRSLELYSRRAGSNTIFVLDTEGQVVASSNWQGSDSLVGQSFHNHPYFQQALEGQASSFYAAASQGDRSDYYFAYPIRSGQQLTGAAVVKIDLQPLQAQWGQDGSELMISDGYGVVVLASRSQWRYRYLYPLFDSTLELLGEQRIYGKRQLQPFHARVTSQGQGSDLFLLDQPSDQAHFLRQSFQLPQLNWTVHYLASLVPVYGFANRVAMSTLILLLVVALIAALMRERRLKRASRAQARSLLEQSGKRQQAIINNTNVGLMLLTAEGEVRFLNQQTHRILGLGDQSASDLHFNQLIPEPDWLSLSRVHPAQHDSLTPLPPSTETWVTRHDGSRVPLAISIRTIDLQPDIHYLVTLVDISRRKAAEEQLQAAKELLEQRVEERTRELQEAQQELIQASKLAALGEMSASIAHEFNQPLTAMRTYLASSEMLLDQGATDRLQDNLRLLRELTERTSTIAAQLKTYAYNRPTERNPVNLVNALQQVLPMFRQRIDQLSIDLVIKQPDRPVHVAADSGRIQLILTNLIKNAIESLQHHQHPRLVCEFGYQQQLATISIRDNGEGIKARHLSRLFDPFFTTKEVGEGLGLGLSIVAGFIRDLDGTIEAKNNDNGGATFIIRLPLFDPRTQDDSIETHHTG